MDCQRWKTLFAKGQEKRPALPGGFGEVGYSPTENILKEIQEETAILMRVIRLLRLDTNSIAKSPICGNWYLNELLDGNFKN